MIFLVVVGMDIYWYRDLVYMVELRQDLSLVCHMGSEMLSFKDI